MNIIWNIGVVTVSFLVLISTIYGVVSLFIDGGLKLLTQRVD